MSAAGRDDAHLGVLAAGVRADAVAEAVGPGRRGRDDEEALAHARCLPARRERKRPA